MNTVYPKRKTVMSNGSETLYKEQPNDIETTNVVEDQEGSENQQQESKGSPIEKVVGNAAELSRLDLDMQAKMSVVKADNNLQSFEEVLELCDISSFVKSIVNALTDNVKAGAYAATALTEQYGTLYMEGENVHMLHPYRDVGTADNDKISFIDIVMPEISNIYTDKVVRSLKAYKRNEDILNNLTLSKGINPKSKLCLLQTGVSLKDAGRDTKVLDLATYNVNHLRSLLTTTYNKSYNKFTDGESAVSVQANYAIVPDVAEIRLVEVTGKKRDFGAYAEWEHYNKIGLVNDKLFTGSHFLSLIFNRNIEDIECGNVSLQANWFLAEMQYYFQSKNITNLDPTKSSVITLRGMTTQYLPTLQAAFMTGCVPKITLYYVDNDNEIETTWTELLSKNSAKTLLWSNFSTAIAKKATTDTEIAMSARYLNNINDAEPCCDFAVMPKCRVTFEVAKNNITEDFKGAVKEYVTALCEQIIGYMYYNAYQLDVQMKQLRILASDLKVTEGITIYTYVQLLKKIRRLLQGIVGSNTDNEIISVLNIIIKASEFIYVNKADKTKLATYDGVQYTTEDGVVSSAEIKEQYMKVKNYMPANLYHIRPNLSKVLAKNRDIPESKDELLTVWLSKKYNLHTKLMAYCGNTQQSLCTEIAPYWQKVLKRRVAQLLTNVIYVSNFDSNAKGVYRCRFDTFGFKDYAYNISNVGKDGYSKVSFYERAEGSVEDIAFKHASDLTTVLSGSTDVNDTGLHPCNDLFGSNSNGIMCATSKGFMCDFVLRGNGSLDETYDKLNYCGSYAYVFNQDEYNNSTLFGYKALEMMSVAGVKPSVKTCYIGQNMDGSFRDIDLTKADISLSAGSRSGKGTVTNCIIASMVSSKASIVYVDGKPDVSGNIMNLGRYFKAPVLTAECLSLPYIDYGTNSAKAAFKYKPIGGVDSTWFNSYEVDNIFAGMTNEPMKIECGIHDLVNNEKLNRFKYVEFGGKTEACENYETLLKGIITSSAKLDGGEKGTVAPALVLLKMLNLIGFINKTDIVNSQTPYLTALRDAYADLYVDDKPPQIFLFIDEINNISLTLSKAIAWILAHLYIAPAADACVNTVNPFGREGGKTTLHSAKVWNMFKLMLRKPKQDETAPSPKEQATLLLLLEKESQSLGLVTALMNMLNMYVAEGGSDKITGTGNSALRTVYVGQHIAADKLRVSAMSVNDCVDWFTSADGSGGVANSRGYAYFKSIYTGWLALESLDEPTALLNATDLNMTSKTYLDTLLLKKTLSSDNIRIRGRAYLNAEPEKCGQFMTEHKVTADIANPTVDKMESGNGYLDLKGSTARSFLAQTGMFGVARSGDKGLDKNLFKSYAVFNTNDIFDNLVCSVIDGVLADSLFGDNKNASVGFVVIPEVISNDNFVLYAECMNKDTVVKRSESYNNDKPINLKVIKYAPKVIRGTIDNNAVELYYCSTESEYESRKNCYRFKVGSTTDIEVKTNLPGREKMDCRLFEAVKCTIPQFVKAVNDKNTGMYKAFMDICMGNLTDTKYNVGLSSESSDLCNAIVGRALLELNKEYKPIEKFKTGWNYVFKDLVTEVFDDENNTYVIPRSDVGFLDYIKTFMKYFAVGTNDDITTKKAEYGKSLSYGYWLFTALLKDTGIIGPGTPYVTIEDWLYDYSTSSFFPLVHDVTVYKRMLQDFGLKPFKNAACGYAIATGAAATADDSKLSAEERAMLEQFESESVEGSEKENSKSKKFTYSTEAVIDRFTELMSYVLSKLEEPEYLTDTADIATIKAYHDLYLTCAKFIANDCKLEEGLRSEVADGDTADLENSSDDADLQAIYDFLKMQQMEETETDDTGEANQKAESNQNANVVTDNSTNEGTGTTESGTANYIAMNTSFVSNWSVILNAAKMYTTLQQEWSVFYELQEQIVATQSMDVTTVQQVVNEIRSKFSSILSNTVKLQNCVEQVSNYINTYNVEEVMDFIQNYTDICKSLIENVANVDVDTLNAEAIERYFSDAFQLIVKVAGELMGSVNSLM